MIISSYSMVLVTDGKQQTTLNVFHAFSNKKCTIQTLFSNDENVIVCVAIETQEYWPKFKVQMKELNNH